MGWFVVLGVVVVGLAVGPRRSQHALEGLVSGLLMGLGWLVLGLLTLYAVLRDGSDT